MRFAAGMLFVALTGCATARLAGEPPFSPADPGQQRVVVLEPFFETAEWKSTVKTEMAEVMGVNPGFGIGISSGNAGAPFTREVAVQKTVTDKPLLARIQSLSQEHREVLDELRRRRPSWQVTSTGGASAYPGPITLIRVVVSDSELVESDRTLKNLAFGFGLVLLPLQLINIWPVEETLRVYGVLQRFDTQSEALAGRLVRYPSQPDFAVNTNNLAAIERKFGLDVAYTEGLLANETPRDGVLLQGFSQRLAAAIIALVEEQP